MGIGNPILGDDGVGIWVARLIKEDIGKLKDVEVKELCRGGLTLMEEMLDYESVILVDAINTKKGKIGDVYILKPEDFKETKHLSSPHDLDFTTALKFGDKFVPEKMPKEITIYAIEIGTARYFAERLTPTIDAAGRKVARAIQEKLKREN